MALGEATVPIRATLDKLDGDLNQARGKISGALGNLQKLGKISLAGLATGLGAVTAGAGAAAAGIIKLASDAEPLLGLQGGFATITERIGSSSQTMLSALQDASGGLITNRDLMTSFNKAAALVGDDFASRLPDAMSLVQKAAQSTGQDMGFLFDSLVTGVGRVSPMILDNLGIQVSLAEVTEHAAEMFGKQASELSKTEQQAALTDIVMGKLNDTYGDVPDVSQPFAQARVMMANLRDEIGAKLLPVVAPLAEKLLGLAQGILPKLTDILDSRVIPALSRLTSFIGTVIDRVMAGGLEQLFVVFEDGSSTLSSFLQILGVGEETAFAMGQALHDVVVGAQTFVGVVQEALAPVMEAASGFVSWKDVLIGLGVAIASVIIPAIASIVAALAPVILTAAAVTGAAALLRNAWENNWGDIQGKTKAVIDFIVPLVRGAIEGIKQWWARNGDAILAKAAATWEAVKAAIGTAIEAVQAIIGAVVAGIQTLWARHGESITAAASRTWEAVRGVIAGILGAIQGIIQGIAGAIEAFWQAHGAAIVAGAQQAWESIKSAIDSAFANIANALDIFTALFSGDWEGFTDAISATWEGTIETIVAVIDGLWSFISPILEGLWSSISGWFTGIDWGSLGDAIVQGVAGGIRAGAGAIADAARHAAQAALDAAKRLLGISSPSREFYIIGEQIGRGLVEGIMSTVDDVEAALESLFDITGTLGSIGGTFSSVFKARVADPLKAQLDGLDQGIEDTVDRINDTFEAAGWEDFDFASLTRQQQIDHYYKAIHNGNRQLANDIEAVWRMENQRNQTADEYQAAQEKILQLEQQQQDLRLLQAQQDLLNLIRENNLSTSIIAGLELGLDADLGVVMGAMSQAMQALLAQAEEELGIASPSKKFEAIGAQITAGLARGIARTQELATRQMQALVAPPALAMAGAPAGPGTMIFEIDARGAEDPAAIRRAARRGAEEALREAGIKADARART